MLIGAGVIVNFQCIQTYIVDAFTLYAASGVFFVQYIGILLLTYLYRYSNGGGILSALIGRLRISSVCSCDVLCARIWKRGHGTCRDSHRRRLSCVSVSFSWRMPSTDSPAF
jgi:hypothetical protein